MADVKAVRRRVEAYVEFDLFVLKQFLDRFLVSDLLYESPLLEHVVRVVVFAYVVGNKIFHLLPLLILADFTDHFVP